MLITIFSRKTHQILLLIVIFNLKFKYFDIYIYFCIIYDLDLIFCIKNVNIKKLSVFLIIFIYICSVSEETLIIIDKENFI
jgi:hypothetical protein